MKIETIQVIVSAVNILVFIANLGVLIVLVKEFKLLKQQNWVNIFSHYTLRYADIIRNFPETINDDDFDLEELRSKQKPEEQPDYQETMRRMRLYFDMCSEEWFFKEQKWIDPMIWQQWDAGIKKAMGKRAFKDAWAKISEDSSFYDDFKEYMDSLASLEN